MSIHVKVLGGWIEIDGTGGGAAPGGPALEGGEVTQDGDWTIHTFRQSDTLTVLREVEVEVLRVAGGGGGGGQGGGAGGLIPPTTETLTPGDYPVVVGVGGAGGRARTGGASRGGDTTFNGLTAVGGGFGGGKVAPNLNGGDGGSGGGSGWASPRHQSSGTPGQGNDSIVMGGGAGTGSMVWDAASTGVQVWGEWYASGGTEGVAGAGSGTLAPNPGGGGRGGFGNTAAGEPGVDGTGGGGGGGGFDMSGSADGPGGKGGDGIVRIRYQQGAAGGGGDTGGGIAWAAIEGGTVTSYTDGDGVAWNVHTYLTNGNVTVSRAGLARVLVVGGGSTSPNVWADGGGVWEGLVLADEGTSPVVVGVGATPALAAGGSSSALGARSGSGFLAPVNGVPSGRGAGWDVANGMARLFEGHVTTIRGVEEDFARGGRNGVEPRPNSGDGRVANANGVDGIVVISVPA